MQIFPKYRSALVTSPLFPYNKESGNEIRFEQGPLIVKQLGFNFIFFFFTRLLFTEVLIPFTVSKDELPFLAEDFSSFVLHDGWLSSFDRQASATKIERH